MKKRFVFKSLLGREVKGLFATGSCDRHVCKHLKVTQKVLFPQVQEKADGISRVFSRK